MMEKDSDEEDYMEIQRQMKMGSQNIGGPQNQAISSSA